MEHQEQRTETIHFPRLDVGIAQPGELSDEEIRALVKSLIDATYDPLDVSAEEMRTEIKDGVRHMRKRLQAVLPERIRHLFGKAGEAVERLIYPGYTRKEFQEGYTRRLQQYLAEGRLMVGRTNGEVAGAIAFGKWGKYEGREVHETTKGTILPRYRNRGYYTQLKGAAMEHLLREHPGCPVMTVTKNPAIIGHMRKHFPGTQDIPLGSDHPLALAHKERILRSEFEKMVREGNVVLFYDPGN